MMICSGLDDRWKVEIAACIYGRLTDADKVSIGTWQDKRTLRNCEVLKDLEFSITLNKVLCDNLGTNLEKN